MNLVAVAADSDEKVNGKMVDEDQARRQHPGLVELKHRDNTPVVEPAPDAPQSPVASQPPASQPPTSQSPQ
jgi:hypothetical protein